MRQRFSENVAVLAILLAYGAFYNCAVNAQTESNDDNLVNNGIFLRCLNDESLNIAHFLESNGIVGEQKSKLQKLIVDYRKGVVRKYAPDQGQSELRVGSSDVGGNRHETKMDSVHEEVAELGREFLKNINDVLLPHQIERMRQILIQRLFLKSGAEPFEMPLLLASELGLSVREREDLEKLVEQERITFHDNKKKLQREAWSKLEKELPNQLMKAMEQSVGERLDEFDFRHGGQKR